MRNLRQAHDVAEDMSGDGRKDTPRAEEKVRTVEAEYRGVAQLENYLHVNYSGRIFLLKGRTAHDCSDFGCVRSTAISIERVPCMMSMC